MVAMFVSCNACVCHKLKDMLTIFRLAFGIS